MYQYPYNGQSSVNTPYYPHAIALQQEKAEIKKAAMLCGIPMIITALIMQFWSVPFFIIIDFLGIDRQEAINAVSNPVVNAVFGIVISSVTFIIPFTITYFAADKKFSNVIPAYAPQKELWAPFLLIGLGVCSFANIGTSIIEGFFESLGFEYNFSFGADASGIFGFFLAVISTAMVPALVEEYACRGILYGFTAKYGEGFSIITTAVMFSLMHGNFRQIPFALILGLYFGYIRVKSGTLWICVVLHFINNFISTLLSWIPDSAPSEAQNLIYVIFLTVTLVCTAIGFKKLNNFDTDFLKLKNPESVCSEKQKYKWFFTSVFIIVFIIFNILDALSYIR